MRDIPQFSRPQYQNTFGDHRLESPHSAECATLVPQIIPHVFTQTIIPTTITTYDSSLTIPRAAENFGQYASSDVMHQTPAIPPSSGHAHSPHIYLLKDQLYDTLKDLLLRLPLQYRQSFMDSVSASVREDINLSVRPRWTDGEARNAPAFTPPPTRTVENVPIGSFSRPGSSQVPSGTTNRECSRESSWLPHPMGDAHHAVEWLARPQPLLTNAYPPAVPPSLDDSAFFEVDNGPINHSGGVDTTFGDDLPHMVHPVMGEVPLSPLPRRNQRRSRGFSRRGEQSICNKCQKTMLTQSLKRHMKEVHANVKRPRTKSKFIVFTP